MTDTADTGGAAAAESAPAPADTGTAPAPAAEAAPADSSILDTDLPDGMQKFDRSYVEKVRGEAASNRVAAREAQAALDAMKERFSAFDGYDDADLQVWNQLATGWRADPAGAAETMRAIANNVLGDPQATTAEKVEAAQQLQDLDAAESSGQPQDVEQMIEERLKAHEEQRDLNERVANIEATLTQAGYEKGTMEWQSVLWYASNDPEVGGSIEKAIEKMQGYRQSVIDDYVKNVASGKMPPSRVPGAPESQAAAETSEPPRNVKEATARARAFLEGRTSA